MILMMNNVRYAIRLFTLLLLVENFDLTLQHTQSVDQKVGYLGSAPNTSTTTTTTTANTTTTAEDFSKCGRNKKTSAGYILLRPIPELGTWPWMAALGYVRVRTTEPIAFRCGGTLISTRHVLTAAHCVEGSESYRLTVVRLADLDLNDTLIDKGSSITVPVESIIIHPQYNNNTLTNDIAIIRLKNSVVYNSLIRPICLPSSPHMKSDMFTKRYAATIGWRSNIYRDQTRIKALYDNVVPIMENDFCKMNYTDEKKEVVIDERVICGNCEINECQGDTGGPLIIPDHKTSTYHLIGIKSFEIRCADTGNRGIYTRVTYFLDWIESNLT